ncbi:stress response translation initiation inhibitor YciH [archaeon]|nr:stress response translation initiation inhibitor YciH [archaeon]MBT6824001.1 stress response translation initiation inhibitor YciH [archaeon]MBT7107234.1 stress response translation initiation inhibitor YciH [archaeon]MBT7297155.1 stress response translation initiation inhibitor YciH [archaeon]
MSSICSKCGLPQDLCVCETIAKEEQRIRIRTDRKRYGKLMTIIEGIESDNIDLKQLTKKLKNKFACGGTFKEGRIELQGNHIGRVKKELIKLGFNSEMIEE